MKETFKNLKKVYKFGKEYKKSLIICAITSLIFITINIVGPILWAKQVVYLTDNLFKQLLYVSALILGLNLVSTFNRLILRRNTQVFFRGTTKNIQIATSREVLKIQLSDIDKKSSGTFIQRIGNDADEMSRIFTRGMGYVTNILTDVGIFVAIFVINKIIFLFYLVGSIILVAMYLCKSNRVNEKDKIYRKQREKTSGLISELVRGVRDIKMLNAKESFVGEIESNIDDLTKSLFNLRNTDMNYTSITNVISSLIEFSLICLLVYMLSNSYITVAVAIVLYNYRQRVLFNLMGAVDELLVEVKAFNLSSSRVFSILNDNEFKKEAFGTRHIDSIKGNFEFRDVVFGYNDTDMVLDKLNFKVKENETVAFVGKSGAGKTTIFSLLCKLYDIKKGKILLDGKDIKELDEYSIRNNITIISQNPYIFNMSIRDNLRLVKENLSDEDMVKACKLACLDEFIESLPLKYDTVVGEGGVTLSGGQRQRLAIARAFVQDTKIILFDEATSALDNETQGYIQKAINNMKDRYTILIIAHRLSTIVNSDRILLLEGGKITAEGTHKELLKNNKTYKDLYENEIIDKDDISNK